jgi:hypothetical protein
LGSYVGGGYAGLAGYGGYAGMATGYPGFGASYGGYSPYGGAYAGYGNSSYGANPGYGSYGGSSGGYSGSYGSSGDVYNSDLRTGSSLIEAQGRLAVQLEQAKLTREQAKQAGIQTRRQLFDEFCMSAPICRALPRDRSIWRPRTCAAVKARHPSPKSIPARPSMTYSAISKITGGRFKKGDHHA